METSSNNIIEYASLNGALAAAPYQFSIPIDAAPKVYNTIIQSNAYFRVLNAVAPQNQFYAVFWPHVESSSAAYNSPFTLTAMRYAHDYGSLPPPPTNTGISLQYTQDGKAYRSDEDQVMYLGLKSASGARVYAIGGKVFQKPAGRALQVHMHVETGAPTLSSTATFGGTGRSLNTVLNELTDNRWSYNTYTGKQKNISMHGCIDDGGKYYDCLSQAQLHALMLTWRGQSGANSSDVLNNYRDWRVDLSTVRAHLDESPTTVAGVMFDIFGIDNNTSPREGAAIMWSALEAGGTGSLLLTRRRSRNMGPKTW